MTDWWVQDLWQSDQAVKLVSWIFWVIFSITLHELAHGWAAVWEGDDTPRRQQRLTLNPLVHMGPMSLLMFALCGIAWGQMPVNPHRFRHGRRGDILVSAAGPAMNLTIAAVSLGLLVLWMKLAPRGGDAYQAGTIFLYHGVALNIILAAFNLLPIPPLDGSHILAGMSRKARELYARPNAQYISLAVFVLVFFVTPLGGVFFGWTWQAADTIVDATGSAAGNPSVQRVMYEQQFQSMLIRNPELREALRDPEVRQWLHEQGLDVAGFVEQTPEDEPLGEGEPTPP